MVGLSIVEIAEVTVMRYVGNGTYVRDAEYVAPRSRYRGDSTWTTTKEIPSGRLRLVAYAPHYRVDLTRKWEETGKPQLTVLIPDIVSGIESLAARMIDLVAQAERQVEMERRQREAEWRRYEIKENKRRISESIKESRDHLDSIINQWAETRARSDFLMGLEQGIALLPVAERGSIQERVTLARDLLGSIDPMPHFLSWRTPGERYVPKHFDEEE